MYAPIILYGSKMFTDLHLTSKILHFSACVMPSFVLENFVASISTACRQKFNRNISVCDQKQQLPTSHRGHAPTYITKNAALD